MKKTFLLTALSTVILLFAACEASDDDKIPSGQTTPPPPGLTGNALVVNQGQPTDGANTNKNATGNGNLDSRIEVPRIVGGNDNYLLIRTVPSYGINYIIEWNNTKKAQRWTAFQMYKGNSNKSWNRNNWADEAETNEWVKKNLAEYGYTDPFQPDPDLPQSVRTELSQYKNSSYSRGHICASADRLNSKEANEQTFYLSNILPQSSRLNTGTWEDMENKVRTWNVDQFRETLYVVKGGTIDDAHSSVESRSQLTIPAYFFMAVVSLKGGKYNGMAFILEHGNPASNYKNCVFTIDQLEQMTGIDFFCNLPDDVENAMEATVDYSFWKLN
jgi:endonuclease G